MNDSAKGMCPYCAKVVPLSPSTHVCQQAGAGAVLNQPGPHVPLADSPEADPPAYRTDMFRASAEEAGKREAWAAVCELFGVESVPKLIELAERVKQFPDGAAPRPDWDGIVTTLLESNAKLSETISAQGDQI